MRRRIAGILFMIVLAAANSGFARSKLLGAISLPLQGNCRVGHYMPVSVIGGTTIGNSGFIPATCAEGFADDVVVPLLVTSDQPQLLDLPLHVLPDDQRLVAIAGGATAEDAKRLFPGAMVTTVAIDWPLRGSAMAWECLDGIVIGGGGDMPADSSLATLLGSGASLAVKSDHSPAGKWPWTKADGAWWILRFDPIGPRTNAFDIGPLLAGWSPGISTGARRNAIVLAAIFVILALAASLRRGRAAVITLAIVTGGSMLAIGIWASRQPAAYAVIGVVDDVEPRLRQKDAWLLQNASRATTLTARIIGVTRPIATADEIADAKMKLECDRDGRPTQFQWEARAGVRMAFLSRQVTSMDAAPVADSKPVARSPLRAILSDGYPGANIVAELDDAATAPDGAAERWPTLVVSRKSQGR